MKNMAPHQPSWIAEVDGVPRNEMVGYAVGLVTPIPPRTLGNKCSAVLLTEVGSNPSIAPVIWVRPLLKIDVVLYQGV
jgi:hypothetical protein